MRTIILSIVTMCISLSSQAQTMREVFKSMPDSVLPLLSKNNRLDCIDFLDSNMKAIVSNKFDGRSTMTKLTTDYLQIMLTESSRVEMKLLPINADSTLLCRINTFLGPLPDSRLRFYTTSWKDLSSDSFFTLPNFSDFWCKSDTCNPQKIAELMNKFPYYLIEAHFEENSSRLELELQLDVIISEEDKRAVLPYIRTLRYEWRNKRFELLEQEREYGV